MQKVGSFEDLWVWQEARVLVREIYFDFAEGTPGERDYGFRNQIQQAGISIMNNIAEGFERSTDTEKARFMDIAKGSCGEVRSMYYAAEDLRYISAEKAAQRREASRKISRGLSSLASHLRL